jgi:hypothetical protein
MRLAARLAALALLTTMLPAIVRAQAPDTVLLNGKVVTLDARSTIAEAADETPSREEALRLYTQGSAWFTHDDARRGSLEPGRLADLAVLTEDVMTAPAEQIGGIESLLTMVGGRIVYAAGPYAAVEERAAP